MGNATHGDAVGDGIGLQGQIQDLSDRDTGNAVRSIDCDLGRAAELVCRKGENAAKRAEGLGGADTGNNLCLGPFLDRPGGPVIDTDLADRIHRSVAKRQMRPQRIAIADGLGA